MAADPSSLLKTINGNWWRANLVGSNAEASGIDCVLDEKPSLLVALNAISRESSGLSAGS